MAPPPLNAGAFIARTTPSAEAAVSIWDVGFRISDWKKNPVATAPRSDLKRLKRVKRLKHPELLVPS
jgi:hypothetical protein